MLPIRLEPKVCVTRRFLAQRLNKISLINNSPQANADPTQKTNRPLRAPKLKLLASGDLSCPVLHVPANHFLVSARKWSLRSYFKSSWVIGWVHLEPFLKAMPYPCKLIGRPTILKEQSGCLEAAKSRKGESSIKASSSLQEKFKNAVKLGPDLCKATFTYVREIVSRWWKQREQHWNIIADFSSVTLAEQ